MFTLDKVIRVLSHGSLGLRVSPSSFDEALDELIQYKQYVEALEEVKHRMEGLEK